MDVEDNNGYGHFVFVDIDGDEPVQCQSRRSSAPPPSASFPRAVDRKAVVISNAAAVTRQQPRSKRDGDDDAEAEAEARARRLNELDREDLCELVCDCVTVGLLITCLVLAWPRRLFSYIFQ